MKETPQNLIIAKKWVIARLFQDRWKLKSAEVLLYKVFGASDEMTEKISCKKSAFKN